MHCFICAATTVEVRPAFISNVDLDSLAARLKIFTAAGSGYVCQPCATKLSTVCVNSWFITWVGFPCDSCKHLAAFNGDINDLPTGLICDDCAYDPNTYNPGDVWDRAAPARGVWLCEPCFDEGHYGHRQKQLQPILDRLASL